jgi:hypothetical protein
VTCAAAQPVPPSENRDDNINDLENRVRAEFRFSKKNQKEDIIGDPDEPVPHTLPDRQPN